MLFDSHAHVHDPKFDVDRQATLERAEKAGVMRIVTGGCDLADSRRALGSANESDVQASLGVHPHEAKDAPADLAAACDELWAEAPLAPVAVGETGLDYYYDHSPRDVQRAVMVAQLGDARERALPLIFHQRDAYDDFAAILRDEFGRPMRGIVHCFTGDEAQARSFVEEFGLLLGIGGVLTFKNAQSLRDAVRAVGLDNIVLETDSPYLAPEPYRGKRNEPAFIAATATRLAELFQTGIADIIARTGANAAALFAP